MTDEEGKKANEIYGVRRSVASRPLSVSYRFPVYLGYGGDRILRRHRTSRSVASSPHDHVTVHGLFVLCVRAEKTKKEEKIHLRDPP